MRLEWLEDIIAVIETGSFSDAAQRRLVTQPAFSRRIRAIEESLGAELFDRQRKPVVLKPLAANHEEDFRRLVGELRELQYELRRRTREAHERVVIASQHAITTTLSPHLVDAILRRVDTTVRLRSANRDECFALLLTRQADLLLCYQSSAEAAAAPEDFIERAELGQEALIPVFSALQMRILDEAQARGELPVIAYPAEAFLGRIFNDEVLSLLPDEIYVRRKVETALTLAALEFALKGIGVAWVPSGLAREAIAEGRLQDLSHRLPASRLAVAALRLKGTRAATEDVIWSEILGFRHGGAASDLSPAQARS